MVIVWSLPLGAQHLTPDLSLQRGLLSWRHYTMRGTTTLQPRSPQNPRYSHSVAACTIPCQLLLDVLLTSVPLPRPRHRPDCLVSRTVRRNALSELQELLNQPSDDRRGNEGLGRGTHGQGHQLSRGRTGAQVSWRPLALPCHRSLPANSLPAFTCPCSHLPRN